MSAQKPTVVFVHGAFAESASWNPVIEQLAARGLTTVAVANPLRSVTGDAAYVRDVIAGIDTPVVLVGHSYGGMVITEAAARNDAVVALVYVAAFAPDHGESALTLSTQFPGSTLPDALGAYPVSTGGNELFIRPEVFHHQFAADVPAAQAALMAATQRPVTEAALSEGLPTDDAGLEAHPVVVRVRYNGSERPRGLAALHGGARRLRGHLRNRGCIARGECVEARDGDRGDRRRDRRSLGGWHSGVAPARGNARREHHR